MSKLLNVRLFLALSCAAALTACGGGGGGSDEGGTDDAPPTPAQAPVMAKYLGTWKFCEVDDGGMSTLRSFRVDPAEGGAYTYADRVDLFDTNETCSGTADGYYEESGWVSPDAKGSATSVDNIAGDRVIFTVVKSGGQHVSVTNPHFGSYKQVLALSGETILRLGDLNSSNDSDGYPTDLLSIEYTKQ